MFAKKKNLKRQDFLFESGWFETLYKKPNSLHMQQFQISDCEQCDIYILDSSAGVYIDDCKFCSIFIGPSQSSIFVRNCQYVKIICMTQQFRMRQCYFCDIVLWCEAQPIIESSYGIRIGPFPRESYNCIGQQLKQAGLNGWGNNWFDVFDFTPTKYMKQIEALRMSSNWEAVSEIQKDPTMRKLKQKYIQKIAKEKELELIPKYFPQILGIRMIQSIEDYCVGVFHPIPQNATSLTQPIYQCRISLLPDSVSLPDNKASSLGKKQLLFIKFKVSSQKQMKKDFGESLIAVIKNESTLERLESTVFAPFRDEH